MNIPPHVSTQFERWRDVQRVRFLRSFRRPGTPNLVSVQYHRLDFPGSPWLDYFRMYTADPSFPFPVDMMRELESLSPKAESILGVLIQWRENIIEDEPEEDWRDAIPERFFTMFENGMYPHPFEERECRQNERGFVRFILPGDTVNGYRPGEAVRLNGGGNRSNRNLNHLNRTSASRRR